MAGARLISQGRSHPLHVRKGLPRDRAIIATTDPDGCFDAAERLAWRQVRAAARLARMGCDAYAYAMVALGAMDAVVETRLKAWDIEAAIPVIEGAGGFITHWGGKPIGQNGGDMLIAGDARVRDEAIALLA